MSAVLIAVSSAGVTGYLAWRFDQRTLNCGTPWRAAVSVALLVVAVWIVVLIQSAILLKLPGAYGPVQFWINDPAAASFMMGPRVWALFSIVGGLVLSVITFVAAISALFFNTKNSRWYRLATPSIALAIYALACYWFIHYNFYPSA